MKKLLLLPLLLIGITTPVKAEALTWKEFWEPFVESYHYGHDHGTGYWGDWHYDHHHPHPHYGPPRRRRCEVTVTKKQWIPGHYLGNSYNWIPGYWEKRDVIEWRRCGRPDRRRPVVTPL